MSPPARRRPADPTSSSSRCPTCSVGLYVLAPGQPDLQQPHTEDEVYYVVARPRPDHGRRRGPRRAAGLDRVRRDRRPAPVPRHHRGAHAARRVRPGGGLAGPSSGAAQPPLGAASAANSSASSAPRPVSSWRKKTNASSPSRQERLEPAQPSAASSSRRVVVAAQAEVEERARPADRRRLLVLGQLGRAQRGAGRRRAPRTTSSTCHDASWNSIVSGRSRRPDGEHRRQPRRRRAGRRPGRGTGPSRAARRTAASGPSATGRSSSDRPRATGTSRRAGP